tara:strand:- start:3742 stop:4671 length:930 start_codon:yes stop_codon:yes gene_type:complete
MSKTIQQKADTILKDFGLDFEIEKLPLFGQRKSMVVDDNGEVVVGGIIDVESPYFGLYNTASGEIINTVKKGYTISQNREIVELVLAGLEPFGDKLKVVKAGSINGGRRVFIQLAIEGDGVVNGDPIKRYITIIDSNDGSTGLSIGIGTRTASCFNQYFSFYKEGNSKFRHTSSITARIQEIPVLVELALENSLRLVETYNRWNGIAIEEAQIHEMVKRVCGKDRTMDLSETTVASINHMELVYEHIVKETTQKGLNVWGLHSGITSFTTHEKTKEKRDNQNMERMLGGTKYTANSKATLYANELVLAN